MYSLFNGYYDKPLLNKKEVERLEAMNNRYNDFDKQYANISTL